MLSYLFLLCLGCRLRGGCGDDLSLLGLHFDLLLHLTSVSSEAGRRSEFAQTVPDHVLRYEHGVEFIPGMHEKRESYEFRRDLGRARPGLYTVRARLANRDFFGKFYVHVVTFFE